MRWAIRGIVAVALAAVASAGCSGTRPQVTYEVPRPGAGFPYSLVAVDIEVRDTKEAVAVFERSGYVARKVKLRSDTLMTVRLPPGDWRIHVEGKPAPGGAVTFDKPDPALKGAGKIMEWPSKPIEVKARKNRLTNAGKICAHRACDKGWTRARPAGIERWEKVRRLITYEPLIVDSDDKSKKK